MRVRRNSVRWNGVGALARARDSVDEADRVTQKRVSGFLSLPSSSIGKWSTRLMLPSFVLILVNAFVVMPMTEQRTGLELPQAAFTGAIVLCMYSAGISGLFALLIKRERSWAVAVPVIVVILVMGAELADLVIPG